MRNFTVPILLSMFFTLTVDHPASAEEINYGTRIPSTLELIRRLAPAPGNDDSEYRTIVVNDKNDQSITTKVGKKKTQNSVSLQIQFDFDSFSLTDRAIQQLHPLGLALESEELDELNFVLEGHTDAVGSHEYNQILSERRANAVKQHLLSKFQIANSKLTTTGLGETTLLVPERPDDSQNRRVRFLADIPD